MTNLERIYQDIDAAPTFEARVAALVAGLKHLVAESFAGHKLPPEHADKLAGVFPAVESDIPALAKRLEGKKEKAARDIDADKKAERDIPNVKPAPDSAYAGSSGIGTSKPDATTGVAAAPPTT